MGAAMKAEDVKIEQVYLHAHWGRVRVKGRRSAGAFSVYRLDDNVGYDVAHISHLLRPTDAGLDDAFEAKRLAQHYAETKAMCKEAAQRTEDAKHAHDPARDMDAVLPAPHYVEMDVSDWLGTQPADKVAQDAPNYGGWSEGDVLEYLSRFGEATQNGGASGLTWWQVRRGLLFQFEVNFSSAHWYTQLHGFTEDAGDEETHDTLPEAIHWAVERWRELVAESDPMPESAAIVACRWCGRETRVGFVCSCGEGQQRHIMTGDMGQRTEFGFGWHDTEEK